MNFHLSPRNYKMVYISGVVATIIGALDPMEGSIVIAIGSVLLAFATYTANDKHKTLFLWNSILILIGVFFLFFFSSLGGIGGNSGRPLWWGIGILTYPLGWLINIVLLIVRSLKSRKPNIAS